MSRMSGSEWRTWLAIGILAVTCASAAARPASIPQGVHIQGEKHDEQLVCIGALAGVNLYITYGYIGTLADLFGTDMYDANKTRQLLREVRGLIGVSNNHLKKIQTLKITEDDLRALGELLAINDLLLKEADSLIKFIDTRAEEDAAQFEEIRQQAYPRIKALLGIE